MALVAASVVSAALLAGAVERPLDQTAGRAAPKGQPTPGDVAQRFCRLDVAGHAQLQRV
jgi:hypothetical protein